MNKGKLHKAERGEDNNISCAFKVKNCPIIFEELSMEEDALPDIAEAVVGPTVLPTLGVGNTDVARASVNSLMQSKEWYEAVKGVIVCADFSEPIKAATVIQAEQLLCHLHNRVKKFLASRLLQERYKNNFCFRCARIYFPRVAAISCWGGHATDDLTVHHTTDSLFGNDFFDFVVMDPDSSIEGCYFCDIRKGFFIYSGKASPTLCVERVKSHGEAAKNSTKGFYEKYPHQSSLNLTLTHIVFFYHLTACI